MNIKYNIYENYYSWWKNVDKTILLFILSFFIAGLFFSLVSTSLIASDRLNTNSYYFFFKTFGLHCNGFIGDVCFLVNKRKLPIDNIYAPFCYITFFTYVNPFYWS